MLIKVPRKLAVNKHATSNYKPLKITLWSKHNTQVILFYVRLLRGPLAGESGGETNKYLVCISLPEVDECTLLGRSFDHAVLIWYRP